MIRASPRGRVLAAGAVAVVCGIALGGLQAAGAAAQSGTAPPSTLAAQVAGDGELEAAYSARQGAPYWLDDHGVPTAQARALVEALNAADRRGLRPEDYGAGALAARLDGAAAADDAARAALDVDLSRQALRLARHLDRGRVDPRRLDFALPEREPPDAPADTLATLSRSDDLAAALDALEPPYPGYRRLRDARLLYLDLAAGAPLPALPPLPTKTLEPDAFWEGTTALADRLVAFGDLAPEIRDTLAHAAPGRYAADLVAAVERFQARHGLLVDGRLGERTLAAISVAPAERAQQMALALERWRWVPRAFAEPPIVVNLPEFVLRATDGAGAIALHSRVVVGAAFNRQTPVFTGEIRTVVFRPYWNVPLSILRRDLLPRARKDPEYFAKNGYEMVGLPDQTLTDERLEELRRGRIPLRQRPGDNNALGQVKFLFPNSHAVYLHDTPARGLFARARRDLSSGCIRVEQPAELAEWVLRHDPQWTSERIRSAMQDGPDDRAVRVARPVPVYLVYVTAIAPVDGGVHFFDDIYGHDAKLVKALGL